MVAISEKDSVSVNLQILSLSSNKWNVSAGFSVYPLTIVSSSGITGLTSASIALAPDFLASDSVIRPVFVGLSIRGEGSGGFSLDG